MDRGYKTLILKNVHSPNNREQRVMTHEQCTTPSEQQVTSDDQRATSNAHKSSSGES